MKKRVDSQKNPYLSQSVVLEFVHRAGLFQTSPPNPLPRNPSRYLAPHSPSHGHDQVRCKIIEKLLEKRFQKSKTLAEGPPERDDQLRSKRFEQLGVSPKQGPEKEEKEKGSKMGRLQREKYNRKKIRNSHVAVKFPQIRLVRETLVVQEQPIELKLGLFPQNHPGTLRKRIPIEIRAGSDRSRELSLDQLSRNQKEDRQRSGLLRESNYISGWTIRD